MTDNWYLAELKTENKNVNSSSQNKILSVKHEISRQEIDEIIDCFSYIGTYNKLTIIKDIVIQNGEDLKKQTSPKFVSLQIDNKVSRHQVLINANTVSLNYATSIKTFIDYSTKLLRKLGTKENLESFKELCSNFYDNSMEYRFWCNFRNYIIHYDFPYTIYKAEIDKESRVCCEKSHLLEFDNWKQSKVDIEKMDEEINLSAMVDIMSTKICALYIHFFYFFTVDIFKNSDKFINFCNKNNVTTPIFINITNPNDLTNSKVIPLPITELKELAKLLERHPSIKINYIKP